MRHRVWISWLVLLMLLAGGASAQQGEEGTVDELRVIEVLPEPGAVEIAGDAVITVIFNRPVVPLGAVEQMPDPLTIEPAIDGTGEWLNTAIYTFRPAAGWGGGVTYTATITEGLTAVDGATLNQSFSWSFTTVPPQTVMVTPEDGSPEARLGQVFQMTFNMPVDQTSLEENFYLRTMSAGTGTVAGTFEWNETGDGFMFTPDDLLQLETAYVAGFPADRVFDAAGVTALSPFEWQVRTVPFPAVVSTNPADGQSDASPYGGAIIFFASEMNPESFEGLITVEPEPNLEPELYFQTWDNGLQVSFPTFASVDYTITLAPGAEDIYGNAITEPFSFSYTTEAYPPDVNLQVPGAVGFYNAYNDQTTVFLTHLNISRLNLALYDVSLADFVPRVLSENHFDLAGEYTTNPDALIKQWSIESVAPQNARRYELLDLGTAETVACGGLPSRIQVGDSAVVISEPDAVRARSVPGDGEIIELMYQDYSLVVLDGPQCVNDLLWWQVRLRDDQIGWVAESTPEEYLIEPVEAAATTPVTMPEGETLQPGLYFLEATAPETASRRPTRHFLVVGTANITMKSAIDRVTVWVTDVQTGQPIPNAPIQIYGPDFQQVAEGATGPDGILQLDVPPVSNLYTSRMALLDDDEHFGMSVSNWSDGIDPWRFGMRGQYYPQTFQLYMYTDRPVYRPDQPVYFRGVLRSKDDMNYTPSDRETVPVEIFDDQGEIIYSQDLPLTEFGTFSDQLQLAADAPLGFYRVQVRLSEENDPQFEGGNVYFNVAEYRLPEFTVEATPAEPEVVQGDTVEVMVDSAYFFGGKVSDAVVEYNVIARPYFFDYDGPGNYDFSDFNPDGGPAEFYGSSDGLIASGEGTTDASGLFMIEVPADLQDATQSQTFTIEAVVRDESDQVVAGRAEVVVHQGDVYIGARPENYVSTAGQDTQLEFIAVDWNSDPIAGQELAVEIVERRWSSVQEEDPGGRTTWSWEVEEIPVDEASVTTDENGQATYTFVPPNGGIFKTTIRTTDDAGNAIRASTTMWVSSREYVSWRQQNSNRIDLVTDADEYEVGDTAEILITSPFQGTTEALVTVERGGVLHVEQITMESNSTVYELPIEPDYAPNVFVNVMLVKGVDETNPVTAFRMGITQLTINNEQKEITLEITPDAEQAGPSDTVQYTVRTLNYAGEPVPAEVGVGLTDLASLSIAEPNSAPILDVFYGIQSLSVRTSTPLTINTDQITQTILDTVKGGGGGFGEGGLFDIREEFVDTAYWQADLVTDADGTATFSVTLPDNLTTWRLDARAVTRGSEGETLVGQDTFDLLSTKPLLIRPVTPRFFTVGDQVILAAVVNNNTDSAQTVEVMIEGSGVAFEQTATQQITLPAGGRSRVEWPVTVQDVESVDLTFFAREKNDRYADASKPPLGRGDARLLPVYGFNVPETVGTGGVLREADTRTESIVLPDNVQGGDLQVSIEPSLAATTLNTLDVLEGYNVDWIEYTISRFIANVMTFRALDQAGLADDARLAEAQSEVTLALQRLAAQQKVNGGWSWTPRSASDPLVTAYAVLGLQTALNSGFVVDPGMIERAQAYLRTEFITPGMDVPAWQLDRQAMVLYALAYSGQPDVGRTVTLFENANRERLSLYAQALLARTLALSGENDDRVETILSDIANAAITSANGTHWEESERDFFNWNTDTRTTAIILGTWVQLRPDSELIPNIVRWLMVARSGDVWQTTQETAWSVMSLSDWMTASGELDGAFDWDVAFNGESVLAGSADAQTITQSQSLSIDVLDMLDAAPNDLTFTRTDGPGNLYYTAYLNSDLPVPEVEPLNNGIIVQRRYTLIDDPNGESITQARIGDVVQVRLTIIVPNDLYYVTVEDPIPAGTEPIDPNLTTNQQIGTRPTLESNDPLSMGWGWWWFSDINFRDQKVVLNSRYLPAGTYEYVYTLRPGLVGTYNVIPPTAYEVYFPDVYGRGAGEQFTVLPADE